ncbi:DUF1524 domain-containing protein [Arthrobacter alpinus]|uniref:GmrSD restriction endonuclease domain-containing protein n=1 Tax=Arthrobacter alpinus TaxID=656366 RepID=UPI0028F6F030|nr:DUF1524 domain-containing protein [Arthrobacter alpinus]
MSKIRTTEPLRATDFIMGTVLATVLLVTTACGGVSAPAGAPASSMTTETAAASPAQDDPTPMDGDHAPDAGGADLAGNTGPEFAAKALDVLATLPVKGRAPKTGYARTEFGQAWADVDKNGCDTRNDMLNRDLSAKTFKPGTWECTVLTGVLADPYTAATISFVRGADTSSAVQIDHVVALSDAWQKGAQQLTVQQRTAFANDPLNLLAVDGPANQQKSDGDAATWLPPNKSYRCDYVARQISVKATYSLWVTAAEHDAMATVLSSCADVGVPTSAGAPAAETAAPPVAPAPALVPAHVPAPGAEVFYKNCAAVRAAGAAPIRAGQPGFQSKFDGDGDGVGCE